MDSPFDLATAVRVRPWSWLFEIGSSLNVDVHIVDLRTAPVLSAPSEYESAMLHDPEFVVAVGRAQRAQSVETVQIGNALVACVVLRQSGVESGVLAISRRIPSKRAKTEDWRLEQIASFLRPAVEAHLASESGRAADEAQRLTALRRALADADAGSELEAIRVFGTAVSIWEDVEVRAYQESVGGEYVQQWAPAGASDRIGSVLSVPASLRSRELSRIPMQSLDQLGITTTDDLAIVHITATGTRWLFLFTLPADPGSISRLSLYVDIVEESLKRLEVSGTLQLCRRIWDRLLAGEDEPTRGADAALGEIAAGLGADGATLVVTEANGGRAIDAGDSRSFGALQASESARQLVVTRRVKGGGALALGMSRDEAHVPFSSGDRQLLETIVELLEPWAAAASRRRPQVERRAVARPFHQVVEDVVQRTVRNGASVAVVVIRLAGGEVRPGVTHRLAAQIRSHLRAAEPAGALGEGEIAAVLFDANPDQARAVASRLRRLGSTLEDGEALESAAMGIAYCAAGSDCETPLVLAARQDAIRSTRKRSDVGRIQ